MEKFSYALEFYNRNLYDLNDVKLFKRKVKEAEKVESFFLSIVPNIDYVRQYILRSYIMNKKYGKFNRIKYIKGLILADNVIDFDDIKEFSSLVEEKLLIQDKTSVWRDKGYTEDSKNADFLEGAFEDSGINLIELTDSYIPDFSSLSYEMDDSDEDDNDEENLQCSESQKYISQILDNEDTYYSDEFEDMSD